MQWRPGGHFPAALASFTVDGHLLAVPGISVSAGCSIGSTCSTVRSDGAASWEELAGAARTIQEGERSCGQCRFRGVSLAGPGWRGNDGERAGMDRQRRRTRDLGPDGKVLVDDPRGAIALAQATSWVDTISPDAVLDMGGGDSLAAFIAGNAAFLRYWSNGLALTDLEGSAVRGKTGMTELPAGAGPDGRSVGVLGGAGLAVSRYSRQPELAQDLVRWLTSPRSRSAGPWLARSSRAVRRCTRIPSCWLRSPIMPRWRAHSRRPSSVLPALPVATTTR